MKKILVASAASFVLVFAACGKDEKKTESKKTDSAAPTPTPTVTGGTANVTLPATFASNCGGCHGEKGEGVGTYPALAPLAKGEFKDQAAFVAVVRKGTDKGMPAFSTSQISDDDLKTIHSYFSK